MNIVQSTYKRNISSLIAESILNNCIVHINTNALYVHYCLNKHKKKSSLVKVYQEAVQNNNYIRSKYYGRDKRTFRIFAVKGYVNLINESDPIVLKSIQSRYEDGYIVVFDYKVHEYNIFRSLLNVPDCPQDIHKFVSDTLGVPRSEAKVIDSTLLYAREESVIRMCQSLVDSKKYDKESLRSIFDVFSNLRVYIEAYNKTKIEMFRKTGYVVNSYGRKIYPKDESSIFNNIIQSIGTELLIDDLISIDLLGLKKTHILFHRFDSIYFDVDKSQLENSIGVIKRTMENIHPEYHLEVGIQIGRGLTSMLEL